MSDKEKPEPPEETPKPGDTNGTRTLQDILEREKPNDAPSDTNNSK